MHERLKIYPKQEASMDKKQPQQPAKHNPNEKQQPQKQNPSAPNKANPGQKKGW